jgi:hypothetical protein
MVHTFQFTKYRDFKKVYKTPHLGIDYGITRMIHVKVICPKVLIGTFVAHSSVTFQKNVHTHAHWKLI